MEARPTAMVLEAIVRRLFTMALLTMVRAAAACPAAGREVGMRAVGRAASAAPGWGLASPNLSHCSPSGVSCILPYHSRVIVSMTIVVSCTLPPPPPASSVGGGRLGLAPGGGAVGAKAPSSRRLPAG
eukprot:scaffold3676_cov37-Phaeocystis_antarctica.AAC.1